MEFTTNQISNASVLLSADNNIIEALTAIKLQSENDGEVLIDEVEGVTPIEAIEFKFTCNEFLDLI